MLNPLNDSIYSRYVKVYDTTLRDGAQTTGISMGMKEKLKIVKLLDKLGVDTIEAGFPNAIKNDDELFKKLPKLYAEISMFCSTIKNSVEELKYVKKYVNKIDAFCIVGKSHIAHVKYVLKKNVEDYFKIINQTLEFLSNYKKKIYFDAEHFFDGFKYDKEYALNTIRVAVESGADCIVLCDTNGGSMQNEVEDIIKYVEKKFDCSFGVHFHNDAGLALANSIVAVECGIDHVQVTLNNLGERCGNTDLAQFVVACNKMGVKTNVKMNKLTPTSIKVAEIIHQELPTNMPYIGSYAFAHKAGFHSDATIKGISYNHISPEDVGNKMRFPISEQSGKNAIVYKLNMLGFSFKKNDKIIKELSKSIHRELGDAQFYLLAFKKLGIMKNLFDISSITLVDEINSRKARAIISVTFDSTCCKKEFVSDKGLIHAFDVALKSVLKKKYPKIEKLELTRYKEIAIGKGTDAKVKVILEFKNCDEEFTSIAFSHDHNEAAIKALVDAYRYYLTRCLL